jgi:hypothetical protein
MVALFYYSPEVNCYPKIFIEMNEKCIYQEKFFLRLARIKSRFFVFANEIVTKVVGTSFRITAYDNQPNIEVLVRTGK